MCAEMYITELDLTQKRPRSTHTHTPTTTRSHDKRVNAVKIIKIIMI